MQFHSQALTVHLKPRQIVTLPDPAGQGVSVTVKSGSVWITQDSDLADIVLESGQSHVSRRRGQMLIYGLQEADVEIGDSQPGALDA